MLLNIFINTYNYEEPIKLSLFQKIFFALMKNNNIILIRKFLDEEQISLNFKLNPILLIVDNILSNPYDKESNDILTLFFMHPKIKLEKSVKDKLLAHAES